MAKSRTQPNITMRVGIDRIKSVVSVCVVLVGAAGMIGCSNNTAKAPTPLTRVNSVSLSDVPDSSYRFQPPFRIKTEAGQFVEVESPGYACPTMADVDGDGDDDLVVGQFSGGNMRVYRNGAENDSSPKFADAEEWILTDGKRAVVPGVS